jgi:hypothetical protein
MEKIKEESKREEGEGRRVEENNKKKELTE